MKNLKQHCRVGSRVEVLGPDGWQVGEVIKMTPFRIQVRYTESWLQNFEEWVSFSNEMVRFVRDKDESDQDAQLTKSHEATSDTRLKEEMEKGDSKTWIIYCNQCQLIIERQRYYCTYCESPSDGFEYESYDLCIYCFQKGFRYHQHPRSSFAVYF